MKIILHKFVYSSERFFPIVIFFHSSLLFSSSSEFVFSEIEIEKQFSFPVLAGVLQSFGVLFLNKALMYPSTGVVNVIAASNSIVVLILNFLILGLIPSYWKLTGMCVIVSGVTLLTFNSSDHRV